MQPSVLERESGTPLRVLVADGYPDTAWSMAMALQYLGEDARHACDGQTALRLAEAFRPEVVLMDLVLPGLGGDRLARQLRDEVGLRALSGRSDRLPRRGAPPAGS